MNAVICIPVYKEKISYYEEISLQQVNRILSKWDKVYIAPESLSFKYGNNYSVVRFPNEFFVSKDTYSDLLMEKSFYQVFSDYDFLLVYQLDAFVFADKMAYFCNLNYDFIGAPGRGGMWRYFHVGNGGFSLRKIKSCIKILNNKREIMQSLRKRYQWRSVPEDIFWGYCGYVQDVDFCVPSSRLASKFSVENDYVHGMRDIKKYGLPFGCHYWQGENYMFWKNYIESFGYILPRKKGDYKYNSLEKDSKKRVVYLAKRYLRQNKDGIINLQRILSPDAEYAIFGAGRNGKDCIRFFQEIPIKYNIKKIYDNKPAVCSIDGISVCKPYGYIDCRTKIIIASLNYEGEIKKQLKKMGMKEMIDFISFYDLCDMILCER